MPGTTFSLGDRLRVQVSRVDMEDKKIDLELIEGGSSGGEKRRNVPARERQSGKPKGKAQGSSKGKGTSKDDGKDTQGKKTGRKRRPRQRKAKKS